MKKTILLSLLVAFLFSLPQMSLAQETYKSAVGARLGYPLSASYKHFLDESNALEFYLGTRGFSGYRWFSISGAYLIHKPIKDVERLRYYFGGGATVYFWNFDLIGLESNPSTTVGLQGYIGLDYFFDDVPIGLTIDWIPTIFINGFGSGFGGGYGTVGVRYLLSQDE